MAFGLFAKPRRRSSSGGGGKMLDTVIALSALAGVGVLGYYVFVSRKGVDEMLQTLGDGLKKATDALNSTGEAIGAASKGAQDAITGAGKFHAKGEKGFQDWFKAGGEITKKRNELLGQWSDASKRIVGARNEGIGNAFCWAQKAIPFIGDSVRCTDLNKKDLYILKTILVGGSPKPSIKLTNEVANVMDRMGLDPDEL